MRINITIPESVVEDADIRAKSLGISRSAYICMAISFKGQYDDMMKSMPKMLETMENLKPKIEQLENMKSSLRSDVGAEQ